MRDETSIAKAEIIAKVLISKTLKIRCTHWAVLKCILSFFYLIDLS